MSVHPLPFLALGVVSFGLGFGWSLGSSTGSSPALPVIRSADVSDLLERLRPVVKQPDYGYGTYIRFELDGRVELKISAKDGRGSHQVMAPSLDEAVRQIVAPNNEISTTLREWQAVQVRP